MRALTVVSLVFMMQQAFCEDKCSIWYDRDNPSGYGDHEHRGASGIPLNPIQCDSDLYPVGRVKGTTKTFTKPSDAPQVVTMSTLGLNCKNIDNGPISFNGNCKDYEVKFCCPKKPIRTVTWECPFTFGNTYNAESNQCKTWLKFVNEMPNSGIQSLRVYGSRNKDGYTCNDKEKIKTIVDSLKTCDGFNRKCANVKCNEKWWKVGFCSVLGKHYNELNVDTNGEHTYTCQCPNHNNGLWVNRPCSGNDHWGGMDGPTCASPTQTLNVDYEVFDNDQTTELTTEEMFNRFDTDNSKCLNAEELINGAPTILENIITELKSEELIDQIYDNIDKGGNGNGCLDYNEFVKFINDLDNGNISLSAKKVNARIAILKNNNNINNNINSLNKRYQLQTNINTIALFVIFISLSVIILKLFCNYKSKNKKHLYTSVDADSSDEEN